MLFDFPKLEALRLLSKEVLADQVASLYHFSSEGGFGHVDSTKRSVSSTATCVLALVATASWKTDKSTTKMLLKYLLSKKESAGLEPDNPFTTAWILEAVTALEQLSEPLEEADRLEILRKESILIQEVTKGDGGVSMKPYPSSGYLTQLVVRALKNRGKLSPELGTKVDKWAWAELAKQLALIQAESKSQDSFAVAYLLMVVTSLTPTSTISPDESSIQRAAIKTFFDCQLKDGTWPLSRPLFHYPKYGNAYCFEYEMLTQLLQKSDLGELLLGYLPNINRAVEAIASSGYRLAPGIRAWSSGHHPQLAQPESWATASVYHFFHSLDRLLAEAVRRELFRHMELPLPSPMRRQTDKANFAAEMLDSSVEMRGEAKSLKEVLWTRFVSPISDKADGVSKGLQFKGNTPRSAIFFGPPGTSKTELSKEIARFLGWPFLSIDPSMLLRKGMDGIQAEANSIFRILEQTEGVVVLFDEFDELVRERADRDEQPFSRLLTTAMLPKLASMHKRGTLVFIIATNNIGQFDLAIRRPGRFDLVVQVMPPTVEEKLLKKGWPGAGEVVLEHRLEELKVTLDRKIKQQLAELTFGECSAFAAELSTADNLQAATSMLDAATTGSTLHAPVSEGDTKTWAERCKEEVRFNR